MFSLYKKVAGWVERILSFPGVDPKELTLRKDYWIASWACLIVIFALTFIVSITNPEVRILLLYGWALVLIFFVYVLVAPFIKKNLYRLMFFNQSLMILLTFYCILKLGGIPYSGGLIFVGFYIVLFSLDFQSNRYSIILFAIYAVTVALAGILNPFLTVAPEMTTRLNITLWVINLFWISFFGLIFVLNFISQRVKFEQQEAIRLKEIDEMKSKLYSNITHEFRTPLTIINGMTDLLKADPDRWLDEGISKIETNSKVLLHRVNQMLDLSKLEVNAMPINMIQSDIILHISQIIHQFRALSESRQIILEYLPYSETCQMDFDPDKICMVVSNLISNALKYSPPEGIIRAKAGITPTESREFEIVIEDDGPGIEKDALPFIFDRFYRHDNQDRQFHEGTGLGLSITRELVKLMKGSITVISRQGEGTRFTVRLPVTFNAPVVDSNDWSQSQENLYAIVTASGMNKEPIAGNGSDQPEKPILLVVEDNEDVVKYLVTILEKSFVVLTASNGEKGWEKALETIPDIILSDIMMPRVDGIDLLIRVKEDIRTSHIPFVILSAKADIESRLKGLERGAEAYLAKPFMKEELFATLKNLAGLQQKMKKRYAPAETLILNHDAELIKEDAFMLKIRGIMTAKLDNENFDILALCREVAMSRAQLYRKFKSLTDITISEYLRKLRLLKARELLQTTDISVSEAAISTGFKNISHFSRVFSKEFGSKPSDIAK